MRYLICNVDPKVYRRHLDNAISMVNKIPEFPQIWPADGPASLFPKSGPAGIQGITTAEF